MILLWIASSGVVAWRLTGRRDGPVPEPASLVAWPGVEQHRLRTADGVEIGAWLLRGEPGRPVVLFLHGNGASRSSAADLMPFLAQQGLGTMAISMRAHGDSAGEVNDFGYSAGRDVAAAVDFLELALPGRPVVVVGESLGAAAALFSAKECAGRVHGYLLAAPYVDLRTAVWNRCDHHLIPPFGPAAWAGLMMWAPAFLPVSVGRIRPADHLHEIPGNVPVTIFAGEDDRYTRIDEVRGMFEAVRPHAELIAVRGGGHGRFLPLHPEEYRKAILDLAGRVRRAR